MAPQGGLGRPKDPAAAPHEELREAALSCCPKLIFLDSNKMAPFFFLTFLVFLGRMVHYWTGVGGDGSEQPLGEEKGKYRARTGAGPPSHFQPPPGLNPTICHGEGVNDLQSRLQF